MEYEEIIKENMPFTLFIATQYANMNRHNLDGMKSEALLTLCKTAKILVEKKIDSADHESWLVQNIRHDLANFVALDRILPMSYNTYRKQKTEKTLAKILNDLKDQNWSGWATIKPSEPCTRLNDLVDSLGLNTIEESIIEFALAGHTVLEIADMMKIHERQVRRIKKKIGDNLLEILKAEGTNYDCYIRNS